MNWIRFSLILGVIGLTIALTTACGISGAVPATPTAIPTPVVQIAPSPTPIPRSPTPLPTATALPSRTVVPTVTFTPTPNPKDMLLAAFAKALTNLKTYRVEVPEESRYIAVQLPDRMLQEGANFFLKIGGTAWRTDGRGKLQAGSAGSLPFFDRANVIWLRDQFAQVPQVVLLGPGTAEGVPCIGYSANFTVTKIAPPKTPGGAPEIMPVPQPIKIWFATGDGFPRRAEMGPPTSLTLNFFDFNEPFNITPPQ